MENLRTWRIGVFSRLTIIAAAALSLSACSRDPYEGAARSIADGRALAEIQAQLDREPQCGTLLSGITPLEEIDPPLPGVTALLAAGLIEPAPQTVESPNRRRYRITDAARPYIRERPSTEGRSVVSLCYARRQVVRVEMKPKELESDPVPYARYSYRLEDAPGWTRLPAVRAAFPFLDEVFAREHEARQLVRYDEDEGRWVVRMPNGSPDLGSDMIPAFFSCATGLEAPPVCNRSRD